MGISNVVALVLANLNDEDEFSSYLESFEKQPLNYLLMNLRMIFQILILQMLLLRLQTYWGYLTRVFKPEKSTPKSVKTHLIFFREKNIIILSDNS